MTIRIPSDLTLLGRLVKLQPSNEADYPKMKEILSDLTTMSELRYLTHIDQGGWSIDQIRNRYEKRRNSQALSECLNLIIHFNGEVIGNCGFTKVNLDHKNAIFGIILHHPYWGKGLAEECHLLCLDYAFNKLDLHRIEFATFTTNIKMRTFFEKIGISQESVRRECILQDGLFRDDAVYALFRSEWPTVKKNLESRIQDKNPSI